jgi:hypothetical protein
MYTLTLKELQAALKAKSQSSQSGAVNKTSLESTAQDDDFQEIKRRKRRICNNNISDDHEVGQISSTLDNCQTDSKSSGNT